MTNKENNKNNRIIKVVKRVLSVIFKFFLSIFGIYAILFILILIVVVSSISVFNEDTENNYAVVSGNLGKVNYNAIKYRNANTTQDNKQNNTVVGNIEAIDIKNLGYYKIGYSSHKNGITTSVKSSDFKELADLLMSANSTTTDEKGTVVSKYIGYIWAAYHGSTYIMSNTTYNDLITRGTDKESLISNSTVLKDLYAGIRYYDKETIFTDCSGFANWFYATVFTWKDRGNTQISILANWFNGCSSSSDFKKGFNCTEIEFSNIRAGDVLMHREDDQGHVGVAISNTQYIHALRHGDGIQIGNIKGSTFKKAFRPNINFSN